MNAYMMFISSFISLFILVNVWQALYDEKSTVKGISYEDMLHFVLLNMLIQAFQFPHN